MKVLENLKYTKEHEWVRIEGDVAYIGITDFAQSELGEIVYVEVETVGETIAKDEVFGTIEAVKTTSDLFMPLSGEILEVGISDASEAEELLSSEDYSSLTS